MISPFPGKKLTKAITVVKPKLAEGNYTFTAQLTGQLESNQLNQALESPGFPPGMLEDAISRFSTPMVASSSEDEKLRKDNEDLRKVVSEQQALLKKMISKQSKQKAWEIFVIHDAYITHQYRMDDQTHYQLLSKSFGDLDTQ